VVGGFSFIPMKARNPSMFMPEKEMQSAKCGCEKTYLKSRRLGHTIFHQDCEEKFGKSFLSISI
jgi:hypothetical protein